MSRFFQKIFFVFGISCSIFVTVAGLNGADGLKPLRQADAEPTARLSEQEDFAVSLSHAVNSPLNGPKSTENTVKKSLPVRIPPPPIKSDDVIRGQLPQSGTDVLSERPPHPQGTVNAEALDPKLFNDKLSDAENVQDASIISEVPSPQNTTDKKNTSANDTTSDVADGTELKSKQWANAVLLVVTIVTVMMLVYAVVIAYDYRQRWVQALLTQNNRLAMGSGFEDDLTMK